jgi:hypothetical protein
MTTIQSTELIASYKIRIKAAWQKSVESIIEVGILLEEAKHSVDYGEWGEMFKGDDRLPFSHQAACYLMCIARNSVLANLKHALNLPASWYSLLILSRIPEQRLEELIADGSVNASLQRGDAEKLHRQEASRIRRLASGPLVRRRKVTRTEEPDDLNVALLMRFNPVAGEEPTSPVEALSQIEKLIGDLEAQTSEFCADGYYVEWSQKLGDRLLSIAHDPRVALGQEAAERQAA